MIEVDSEMMSVILNNIVIWILLNPSMIDIVYEEFNQIIGSD
jgi:hypothetical protein